jgi:hypothetical protein
VLGGFVQFSYVVSIILMCLSVWMIDRLIKRINEDQMVFQATETHAYRLQTRQVDRSEFWSYLHIILVLSMALISIMA